MRIAILISLLFWLLLPNISLAQSDAFEGSWHMDYPVPGSTQLISIVLKIASPEKNQLYPAEIKLQCDSFTATYHLLLVKRNIRQLAIGRNKPSSSETPFSVGTWTIYLNGVFDLSRDIKGNSLLTVERMSAKQYGVPLPDFITLPEKQKTSAIHLRDFLKDADIILKKTDNNPFVDPYIDTILSPHLSPDYFGIRDTINVDKRNGTLSFGTNKKTNNGVVSVQLNGVTVVDQNDLTIRKPVEDIKLDTGLNILVFFADNYGKTPATTGSLNVDFENRKFSMDFAGNKDVGATFIVAELYYNPAEEKDNISSLQNGILRELSEEDLQRDIKIYHYPDLLQRNLLKNDTARMLAEKTLSRNAKPVGTIKTSARQIILALWDDAVEDGDTISLNINGNWIVQGFPVKKRPQFIQVTIDPGPNKIVFIANNLGAIPPNTAILEIIDGRQRKSFMIDTDLNQNNLINILYDAKPD